MKRFLLSGGGGSRDAGEKNLLGKGVARSSYCVGKKVLAQLRVVQEQMIGKHGIWVRLVILLGPVNRFACLKSSVTLLLL